MQQFYVDYIYRLGELHRDITNSFQGLTPEALDWNPGQEMNSIAILVAHIAGAERYWVVDVVGKTQSGRDRPAEFRTHGLDTNILENILDRSLENIREVLDGLNIEDLEAECFSTMGGAGGKITVAWALLHSLGHSALHLGHIQILRQLWDQRDQ